MKVAVAIHHRGSESTQFLGNTLLRALKDCSDVVVVPTPMDSVESAARRMELAAAVASCDVLIGYHSTIEPLLVARARNVRKPRCVVFALGGLPRGALHFRRIATLLGSDDTLVVNSSSDAALAKLYFSAPRIYLLPLAYNDDQFYRTSEDEIAQCRRQYGIQGHTRMVLYSGKLTVEKNVHTLLRVFGALRACVADVHLVIAGQVLDTPFAECGVVPINYGRLVCERLVGEMDVADAVTYVGPQTAEELRQLYSAADVVLNLTLHHDENFGMVQVEATACGTPVVGTAWGGLKDTITEGGNGIHIRTAVTPTGIKVNWWEAVSKVEGLLRARDEGAWKASEIQSYAEKYRASGFTARVDTMLKACVMCTSDSASISYIANPICVATLGA